MALLSACVRIKHTAKVGHMKTSEYFTAAEVTFIE